ncbi:hypothetical protein RHSIM_Rhsim10G0109800 [Rhododendron simsii]|uniref:Uncharacterized protein n=1 Tax=Rhododendron simsii TaxID=118357 RepID=A0A834GFH0_RHOSS|nr:hypothetical protein RHSIM_Rhsim10G0109800 [Rhododendron simsii]
MTDKKIEALAGKVNVLAESVATLATIVHNLQGSPPQAPPPLARWTEKAVQTKIHFVKERQGRKMMNLQPQHVEQIEEEITQPKRSLHNYTVATNVNPSQHNPTH